jgi:DNA repair protein RadC
VKYELGTIQVTAELKDQDPDELTDLSGVTQKYGFLRNQPKEHFYTVFLNSDNEVIGDKLIGLGDTSTATVDTTDIARTAVLTNASAVILVHNHPSTNPQPTEADKETTHQIQDALNLFTIQLLDHVIISRNNSHSMNQHNQL